MIATTPRFSIPPFRPHPLLRGGHAQTLAGVFLPAVKYRYAAVRHEVALDDGDRVVLHDDAPPQWRPGDKTVLLVHGLSGCYLSGYMQRIAARLAETGVRAFRMDMRGCGAAFPLCQYPPHSGRVEDVHAALRLIARLCPDSPTALVGFSLGGNVALNVMAQADELDAEHLKLGIAVCPPIDLVHCSERIEQGSSRIYSRYFIKKLLEHVKRRRRLKPDLPPIRLSGRPRTLWEFDHAVTAPLSGFASADEYYRQTSPAPHLTKITRPTLIVAAEDDPLVPVESFAQARLSPAVHLHLTPGGGHLGFIGHANGDRDRRWIDWRVLRWVEQGLL